MKKAYSKKISGMLSAVFYIVCLSIFNLSCGLDVYNVVDPPTIVEHTPYYTSDYNDSYFCFITDENTDNPDVQNFKGTSIYYKIYNSYSTMSSEVSSITSYIYSDDNKAKAADRLINTYDFKTLRYRVVTTNEDGDDEIGDVKSDMPLIENDSANQKIQIRLTDYLNIEDYKSRIFINKKVLGQPVRYQDGYNFNFGRVNTDEYSRLPEETDSDVKYSSSTDEDDENKWYVPMFAVGVDLNIDYSYNYSVPLYLGCVTIDDSTEDN